MNRESLDRSLGLLDEPGMRALAAAFSENLQKKKADLGFNVFSLVSDVYHRENFHSDLISAFLDPAVPHGLGRQALDVFFNFLACFEIQVDSRNYPNPRVLREHGRIDILIRDESTKHAVIVENKINGAVDMPGQIPRYYRSIVSSGYTCDAIVYLRLIGRSGPEMANWFPDDHRGISSILRTVPAYDETEPCLDSEWIQKCLAICDGASDAASILRQYTKLISNLGKHVMNKPLMDKFYTGILDEERFETAISLQEMLRELIRYRTERLVDLFLPSLHPFTKVGGYKDHTVCFTGLFVGKSNLCIDIEMSERASVFCFWDRNDPGDKSGLVKDTLTRMGMISAYKVDGGWYSMNFDFPSQEAELVHHIRQFKAALGGLSLA